MNSILASFFLSFVILSAAEGHLSSSFAETPLWEKMQRLTWKNRVIVVYTPNASAKDFQKQRQFLSEKTKGLKERDLVIIECVGKTLSSEDKNYVARHFNHDLSAFGVWLVGKDGGTKLSENKPVTTEEFFSLIDAMPMRQAEIRKR